MENKNGKVCPEAIVGALITNDKEEILLAKSVKWSGRYTVFGGHVEIGETMEDAIRREVKEEAGIDVNVIGKIGFLESIFDKDFNAKKHFIFLDFYCQYSGDNNAIVLNEEFEENQYIWVSVEEALKMDVPHGTRRIIEEYLEYKKRENYLEGWKRCQADFENYKKRQAESLQDVHKYACQNIISEILPVLDNFHASTEHIPEDQKENPWVTGIMHIQKQLEKVLEDNNVKEIKIKQGDEFDPTTMDAVKQESKNKEQGAEEENTNVVNKVVLKGYKIGERVIRAARVIVE